MSDNVMQELERLSRQAEQLAQKGEHLQAVALARQAADLACSQLGETHPATIRVRNRLAELLEAAGAHDEAEAVYLALLEALHDSLADIQPGISQTLTNLARVRKRLARQATDSPTRLPETASRSVGVAPVPSAAPQPQQAPGASAAERVSRHATVRYYRRMAPRRVYPLLVVLSKGTIRTLTADAIEQGIEQTGAQEFTASQGSSVVVEPILPGCTCYPTRQEVSLQAETATARFHIVAGMEGAVPEARVELSQGGRLLAKVPLEVRVGKQRLAALFGLCAVAVPYAQKYFQVDAEAQLWHWLATLPWWLAAGGFALAAAASWLWQRPQQDTFWNAEIVPPTQ
jgi:hypothetical protein